MCGVTLLLVDRHDDVASKSFRKSCKYLRARGPDFSGHFQAHEKRLSMGHERLAIVRPETGQQPLFNADRSVRARVLFSC